MPARPFRILATVAAVAGAATMLTSCDKPVPNVTFQTGSTSIVVKPQAYCFDANPADCRITTSGAISTLDAKSGGTILVDVPRDVAGQHWSVNAATQSGNTFTPLDVTGASVPALSGTHSARVVVPYSTGLYYLIVAATSPGSGSKQTASWVTRVNVSN
jgi:hypothetical protein